MTSETNEAVVKSLDRIGRVLAAILLKGMQESEQRERVVVLKRCSFSNQEIAEILGTTANTVGVALHSARRKGRRSKKSTKKQPKEK